MPVASGRLGVRSPSKYGTSTMPPAPGRRRAPAASRSSRSTPSRRAIASVTFVALSVQTSGRKRPVASAKPHTRPVGSLSRHLAHREHGARRAERDRDVARLAARARARPPCCRRCRARRSCRRNGGRWSVGPTTSGRRRAQSMSRVDDLEEVEALLARPPATSSRCRTRRRGRSRSAPVSRHVEPVVREQHAPRRGRSASGSVRCSHDSFVIVNDGDRDRPARRRPTPSRRRRAARRASRRRPPTRCRSRASPAG